MGLLFFRLGSLQSRLLIQAMKFLFPAKILYREAIGLLPSERGLTMPPFGLPPEAKELPALQLRSFPSAMGLPALQFGLPQ